MRKAQKIIPFRTALKWISFSVIAIVGSTLLAFAYYHFIKERYAEDAHYQIIAIVQSTTHSEPLKTSHLAEILNLSTDIPVNIYRYRTKEARHKLLSTHVIKEALVKKIRPGTIYVDYQLREPIAYLTDYTNTAIDEEGIPFPFHPFFTPKNLPEIYLGFGQVEDKGDFAWGKKIKNDGMSLALSILKYFHEKNKSALTQIKKIDVSQAFTQSLGHRQLIVIIDEHFEKKTEKGNLTIISPRILRLNVNDYRNGISRYFALQPYLIQIESTESNVNSSFIKNSDTIIDLRLPKLAYIQKKQ